MTVALKAPLPRLRTADLARRLNVGVVIFAVLFAAVAIKQPSYIEPAGFLNFLRRAAPLAILACGQVFVIVAGGFDLSVGSLVTLDGHRRLDDDRGRSRRDLGRDRRALRLGLAVGLINGLVVSFLKVPSIIATLGMLLSLNGVAMMWSGGSPRGYLPANFRMFGRLVFRDVPVTGTMPLAVLILAAVAGLAWWGLHGTVFGRRVFAVGDNPRAAELAGVPVASRGSRRSWSRRSRL